jgi:hypothetical protein
MMSKTDGRSAWNRKRGAAGVRHHGRRNVVGLVGLQLRRRTGDMAKWLGQLGYGSAWAAFFGVAACARARGLSAPSGPARSVESLAPVFLCTVASVALLYAWLYSQSVAGFGAYNEARAAAKKADKKPPTLADIKYAAAPDKRILIANRTVGNYMEQYIPFLVGLYGHALFVDANAAASLGWLWLAFRSYYPFVFGAKFPALLASTLPAYGVLWWMIATAVLAAVRI